MITIDKKGIKHITGKGFRLVYNDTKVVALIEGTESTITSANYSVEEQGTKQGTLDRIDALKLPYDEMDDLSNALILKDKK